MSSPLAAAHRGLPKLPIGPHPAAWIAMRPAGPRDFPTASDRDLSRQASRRKPGMQPHTPGRKRPAAAEALGAPALIPTL